MLLSLVSDKYHYKVGGINKAMLKHLVDNLPTTFVGDLEGNTMAIWYLVNSEYLVSKSLSF